MMAKRIKNAWLALFLCWWCVLNTFSAQYHVIIAIELIEGADIIAVDTGLGEEAVAASAAADPFEA